MKKHCTIFGQFLACAPVGIALVLAACSATTSPNATPGPLLPPAILAPTVAIAPIHLAEDPGKIVFESDRDGNMEIYAMNPDGSTPTRLTTNEADDSDPTWSPDWQRIAFVSDRDGNP